jgi:DNA polymerase-1
MMPDLELMHCSPQFIPDWVEYSCFDAEILYFLRETLAYQLLQKKTNEEMMGDNLTLYMKYWRPFGEILTDMERTGFQIDKEYLRQCELVAMKDSE